MNKIPKLQRDYDKCVDQSIKHNQLGNDLYEMAWDYSAIQLLREIEQLKEAMIFERKMKDYAKI